MYRSQLASLCSLWSSGPSIRSIFPASFGHNQLKQIIANLSFDSREDSDSMEDKFAVLRQMWEKFIDNCRTHCAVGAFVTVDEQQVPLRSRSF